MSSLKTSQPILLILDNYCWMKSWWLTWRDKLPTALFRYLERILNSPTSHSCKSGNCWSGIVRADIILGAPLSRSTCGQWHACQPTQRPLASALWAKPMYRRPANDQHLPSLILSTSREATRPSQDTNSPMAAFSRKLWLAILQIFTWNLLWSQSIALCPRKQPKYKKNCQILMKIGQMDTHDTDFQWEVRSSLDVGAEWKFSLSLWVAVWQLFIVTEKQSWWKQ